MSDLCCYLCGSSEDVEEDDRLGTLPVAKPMCANCWFDHPNGDIILYPGPNLRQDATE